MSATVRSDGTVVPHIGRTVAVEQFSSTDVQDPEKLARMLNALRSEVTASAEQLPRSFVDFEDQSVTTDNVLTLAHGLGGRVRFAVVEWTPNSAGTGHALGVDDATTDDALALYSGSDGTVTVRVWRAD